MTTTLIDIPITISNGGSHTSSWIVNVGEIKYGFGKEGFFSNSWLVEKFDGKFFRSIDGFRCKDPMKALSRGMEIILKDYQS